MTFWPSSSLTIKLKVVDKNHIPLLTCKQCRDSNLYHKYPELTNSLSSKWLTDDAILWFFSILGTLTWKFLWVGWKKHLQNKVYLETWKLGILFLNNHDTSSMWKRVDLIMLAIFYTPHFSMTLWSKPIWEPRSRPKTSCLRLWGRVLSMKLKLNWTEKENSEEGNYSNYLVIAHLSRVLLNSLIWSHCLLWSLALLLKNPVPDLKTKTEGCRNSHERRIATNARWSF